MCSIDCLGDGVQQTVQISGNHDSPEKGGCRIMIIQPFINTVLLSSPGPKPLAPKPKYPKTQNQGALGWH